MASKDEEIARFLRGEVSPAEVTAEVARPLVALLVEQRDAERLATLAARGGRDAAKEARRGLHLLRTKGIVVPAAAAGSAPRVSQALPPDLGEAWSSPPDGKGERLVSVLRPAPTGGFDQLHLTVSDEGGLMDVVSGHGPKKLFRALKRRFEQSHMVYAEVPLPWAIAIIEEAYERTVSAGRSPPPGYAAVRSILTDGIERTAVTAARAEHPALTEVTPATELDAEQAAGLHELPDLLGWVPSRDVLGTLSVRLEEIATSQIVVNERQRSDARTAAVDAALAATFDDAGRARWRRRLLDAALVYGRAGHEDDAARLRAQADRMGSADFVPTTDPFARALVEKLLPPEPSAPAAAPGGGLIITP